MLPSSSLSSFLHAGGCQDSFGNWRQPGSAYQHVRDSGVDEVFPGSAQGIGRKVTCWYAGHPSSRAFHRITRAPTWSHRPAKAQRRRAPGLVVASGGPTSPGHEVTCVRTSDRTVRVQHLVPQKSEHQLSSRACILGARRGSVDAQSLWAEQEREHGLHRPWLALVAIPRIKALG